jgi:hypothetical protein
MRLRAPPWRRQEHPGKLNPSDPFCINGRGLRQALLMSLRQVRRTIVNAVMLKPDGESVGAWPAKVLRSSYFVLQAKHHAVFHSFLSAY